VTKKLSNKKSKLLLELVLVGAIDISWLLSSLAPSLYDTGGK
jgi:hypothetical protein